MPFQPQVFPKSDPASVFRYRDGLYAVDLIGAAVVEFDFFSWLCQSGGATETEIREHFSFADRPLDVMITLFVANDFVVRNGARIEPTTIAREFLSRDSPWGMRPYYESLSDRPVLKDFVQVLRTGRPANWGSSENEADDWHDAMERDDFAEKFTAAMDCRGLYLGQALAERLDLASYRRALDIGGGSGIYGCVLAERFPELAVTVLEKPPVDEIARRAIGKRGCGDRVSVQPADMFEANSWPEADVHLWSNVLHDWDLPEVEKLLTISAEKIAPGGMLIIHEAILNAAKSGPLPVAEYSALLMNVTQGKCYSVSEFEALLRKLGFEDIEFQDTVADRGMMTAKMPS